MNGRRNGEMLPTSLCACVQQIPTSLYICGFYCKNQYFHFFRFCTFFAKKSVFNNRIYADLADLAENGYFARKK